MTRKLSWKQVVLITVNVLIAFAIANYELWLPWQWKVYESPDRAFTVSFPGMPEASNSVVKTSEGTRTITTLAVQPSARVAYMCIFFDVRESGDARENSDRMDEMVKGGLDKVSGKILKQEELLEKGLIGRRVLARIRGDSTMDIEIFLTQSRAYMLGVVSNPNARNERNINHFFGSLKVKPSLTAKDN